MVCRLDGAKGPTLSKLNGAGSLRTRHTVGEICEFWPKIRFAIFFKIKINYVIFFRISQGIWKHLH